MTESEPASSGPSAAREKRARFQIWLLAAFLVLATVILYWPATHHDFLDYDDNGYVTANAQVQNGLTLAGTGWAFAHPVGANWHPLTMLSHMLDCQLYGLRPWGHHLTNVLLHALNAALVFLLLNRLSGTLLRSAVVAALFAWHPLHVESVAWVAERKDVLCGFFFLLTLLAYARYAESAQRGAEVGGQRPVAGAWRSHLFHRPSSIFYLLSLSCFALALLSKPMAVTLPFVLLLLDYWPLERFTIYDLRFTLSALRSPILWRWLIEKIPFLALSVAASVVTFLVQQRAGAVETVARLPLELRCENALISYCRYLFKLFWPADLAVFYPQPAHWPAAWVLLAGLFLGTLTVFFWRQRQRGPFLLVGWLWFVVMLVPVIGLVQVGRQAMADRYTYLPSVGLFMLVVWGVPELFRPLRRQVAARASTSSTASVGEPAAGTARCQSWLACSLATTGALVFCAVTTRQQLAYWQNGETLFRHSLKVTPDNDVAHLLLGVALLDENQTNAAVGQFEAALRLKPDCADAYEDLGNIAAQQGRVEDAIGQYQEVLRCRPNRADAHSNLGSLLAMQGRTNDAIGQFQEAIRLDSACAETHENLGNLEDQQGQTEAAIGQYQEVLRLQPNSAAAHGNLGNLLAKRGQTDAAIGEFQAALLLAPEAAQFRYQFGSLLAKLGRMDEAIIQFQAAIHWQADFALAHNSLGVLFAKQGHLGEALAEFEETVRLEPKFASAHNNLANLFAMQGRRGEAIAQFQESLRLNPGDAFIHYKLGELFAADGRLDDSVSQFQEALRLRPNYLEASNHLARVLEMKTGTGNY